MTGTFTALVVEQDEGMRAQLSEWMTEAGFTVLTCAGPVAPDYVCPGGRGDVCPLAESADLVVFDLHLAGDTTFEGPPGWQILQYYCESGKPVVALADADDFINADPEELLRVIGRAPERDVLIEAARSVLRHVSLEPPSFSSSVEDLVVRHDAAKRDRVGADRQP